MPTRRKLLHAALAASVASMSPTASAARARSEVAASRLRTLERGQARLGVCLLDTGTGESCGHRMEERFAFCSTFKLALVAACLREADHGRLDLSEVLDFGKADLLPWAPVTGQHVDTGGLPIMRLAEAAQTRSDGVAANLLVRRLGGPAGVTALFRAMGDTVTRLDRYEPDLGLVLSADVRDTTTPMAMAQLVRRVMTGDLLRPDSRDLLLRWMLATDTGPNRLRAGLPKEWSTGNKTGTGRAKGTTNKVNDVAITFPKGAGPMIIAAYYDSGEFTERTELRHEQVLAKVGEIAAGWAIGR
jgi:beta-lactamase class A